MDTNKIEDKLFGIVGKELSLGRIDQALWTKAFALENGDDRKTRAHYIRLRVEQLQNVANDGAGERNEEAVTVEENVATVPVSTAPEPATEDSSTASQPKSSPAPWARFFARSIDLGVVLFLATLTDIMLPRYSGNILVSVFVSALVFGVVLLAYEAMLIGSVGTTVGKACFGLSIVQKDGGKPEFSTAIRRSVWAWISGNGCYFFFPAATVFTWWAAYRRLTSSNSTSWDERACTSVNQRPIGGVRFRFGAVASMAIFLAIIVITYVDRQDAKSQLRAEAFLDDATSRPETQKEQAAAAPPLTQGIASAPPLNIEESPSRGRNRFDAFDPNNATNFYTGTWGCTIAKAGIPPVVRYVRYTKDGRLLATADATMRDYVTEYFRVNASGDYSETIGGKWIEASVEPVSEDQIKKLFRGNAAGIDEVCVRFGD